MKPASLAAQAMGAVAAPYGEISPPIHVSTTYERAADGTYPQGRAYGRADNPTYDQAEAVLAALEHGAQAALFASGMAAAVTVFQTLKPGDQVIAPRVMYWGLRRWLIQHAAPRGLKVDFFDNESPGQLDELSRLLAPGKTKLVWIETPANPTWAVTDIEAAAALAHAAGARVAVDSTVATPVLTQPIKLGADIVMHSATKALNGHSDVVAGALVTARDDAWWKEIVHLRSAQGAVPGPFEAWLVQRGMRTLYVRMAAACANAAAIAKRLHGHKNLVGVLYPGLADFPGHEVAARQMHGGFGAMLSIRVRGGQGAAMAAAARLKIFKRATSLGGVESLVEHRASVEGPESPCPPDLLRLSAGIEAVDDLISDLEQALR
jgi:cystathionine gamma-synthase